MSKSSFLSELRSQFEFQFVRTMRAKFETTGDLRKVLSSVMCLIEDVLSIPAITGVNLFYKVNSYTIHLSLFMSEPSAVSLAPWDVMQFRHGHSIGIVLVPGCY